MIFGEPAKFYNAGVLIPVEDYINKYPPMKNHYEPFMDKMFAAFDGEHVYKTSNTLFLVYSFEMS